MRNIILFLRRYSVLLLFLLLQTLAIVMLVQYNKSQQARYMQWSYEITGRINKQVDNLTRYIFLNDNNRRLSQQYTDLRNQLASNFIQLDSAAKIVADTIMVDSSKLVRKYLYRYARVVNGTTALQNNYVTLERGANQGVATGMAVLAPGGIIGLVVDVSPNMSLVMSLLHRKQSVSVSIFGRMVNGILEWDGENPDEMQLNGIPNTRDIAVGDSIVTSNISINFPPGLMVGTITNVEKPDNEAYYKITVKPGANFYGLEHVQVIENTLLNEQKALEAKADRSTN